MENDGYDGKHRFMMENRGYEEKQGVMTTSRVYYAGIRLLG